MLDYLDKLRMKPRHVRERIAFSVTAVFSVFIVSMWWVSWTADRMPSNTRISEEITPVGAVADIAEQAQDSTSELFGSLVDPIQYNASGTTAVAQVISAFQDEAPDDTFYLEDPVENVTDTNAIPIESSTSTPVE